jgi:hypothetical protein
MATVSTLVTKGNRLHRQIQFPDGGQKAAGAWSPPDTTNSAVVVRI